MGKHDFMSPKAVANRMKAKGLQRLRWYCQMCEKQCRDQNGFKCHCASESHQRQMAIFAQDPERYIQQFSDEFEQVFLSILSRRYGTKKVNSNQVYQEIVADRQHLHMNATKWDTLSDFVKYLGREGKCRVEETDRGWAVEWIDTSDEAMARQAAIQKKERQEMDDEQREHRLLQEQVERARKAQEMAAAARKDNTDEPVGATELKRENPDQPIKLSWKKPQTKGLQGLSSRISKPVRPLAKANPFKTAAAATSKAPGPGVDAEPDPKPALKKAVPKKLSAAEEMMLQDQLRKARQGNDSERRPNASSLERRRSRSPRRH